MLDGKLQALLINYYMSGIVLSCLLLVTTPGGNYPRYHPSNDEESQNTVRLSNLSQDPQLVNDKTKVQRSEVASPKTHRW